MKTLNEKSINTGLILTLLIILITLADFCKGQSEIQPQLPGKESTCLLKSFTVKQVEQKNYLNWLVVSTLSNYYFVLEKSSEGKTFSTVSIKKGTLSPANQALLYCFTDEAEHSIKTIYRLSVYEIHWSEENIQLIYFNEKNIFGESQNSIIEVNNDYKFLPPPPGITLEL